MNAVGRPFRYAATRTRAAEDATRRGSRLRAVAWRVPFSAARGMGWAYCAVGVFLAGSLLPAHATALTPNDFYYSTYQGYLDLIGAPAAWEVSTGSPGVIVAVLDSGVNAATPDLAGRVLPGISTSTGPVLDGITISHGTQVASVVAMDINNGIGGAGIGRFTILPITVTNTSGGNVSYWLADGVRRAAAEGAKAIVLSLSTLTYGPVNEAAAEVADRALVFVAAGNSNSRRSEAGLPNYEHLIFVSGTMGDNRAVWSGGGSSWGPAVDLSAPAVSVLVADPTVLPNGYGLNSGTSFAAPIAAGAAALAWSINPDLTPAQVKSILYSTATDLGDPGWDEVFGHGRVNLAGVAAAAAATVPEPATAFSLAVLAAIGTFRIRASRRRESRRRGFVRNDFAPYTYQ